MPFPFFKRNLDEEVRSLKKKFRNIQSAEEEYDRFNHYLSGFQENTIFYTLNDLSEQYITCSKGIQQALGYDDITDKNNWQPLHYITGKVHPSLREWYRIFSDAALLCLVEQARNNADTYFSISMPLKKINGDYVLGRQTCRPYSFTGGELKGLISTYTLGGEYWLEPFNFQFFVSGIKQDQAFTDRNIIKRILLVTRELEKEFNLEHRHLAVIKSMKSLKAEGKPVTEESIYEYGTRVMKQDWHEKDTVRKYLDEMKSKWGWLYTIERQIEGTAPPGYQPLPFQAELLDLVKFLEQCSLVDLFVANYNKYNPAKKKG